MYQSVEKCKYRRGAAVGRKVYQKWPTFILVTRLGTLRAVRGPFESRVDAGLKSLGPRGKSSRLLNLYRRHNRLPSLVRLNIGAQAKVEEEKGNKTRQTRGAGLHPLAPRGFRR